MARWPMTARLAQYLVTKRRCLFATGFCWAGGGVADGLTDRAGNDPLTRGLGVGGMVGGTEEDGDRADVVSDIIMMVAGSGIIIAEERPINLALYPTMRSLRAGQP